MLHTCTHSTHTHARTHTHTHAHTHTHTHIIDTLVDIQTGRGITFAGSEGTGTPPVGLLAKNWTRMAGHESLETGASVPTRQLNSSGNAAERRRRTDRVHWCGWWCPLPLRLSMHFLLRRVSSSATLRVCRSRHCAFCVMILKGTKLKMEYWFVTSIFNIPFEHKRNSEICL